MNSRVKHQVADRIFKGICSVIEFENLRPEALSQKIPIAGGWEPFTRASEYNLIGSPQSPGRLPQTPARHDSSAKWVCGVQEDDIYVPLDFSVLKPVIQDPVGRLITLDLVHIPFICTIPICSHNYRDVAQFD
jgi:hypothetical protein